MARRDQATRARASRASDGTPVWDVTSLGGAPDRRRGGPKLGLAGALGTGIAILVVYLVVSLIAHLFVAAVLWVPAIVLAGMAVRALANTRRVPGSVQLIVGVLVLVAVRTFLGRVL